MRHHRLTRSAALAFVLTAFAVPTAAAQQDLRSPDARDASPAAQSGQDLRSPDSRDAAVAAQAGQDLRSPDSRDAAAGRGTFSAPDVAVVKLEQPAPSTQASSGLDWSAAVMGAGSVVGLMLLALGTVAIVHRRHSTQTA